MRRKGKANASSARCSSESSSPRNQTAPDCPKSKPSSSRSSGFARSIGAQQRHAASLGDREAEIVHRRHALVPVSEVIQFEQHQRPAQMDAEASTANAPKASQSSFPI